MTTRRFALAAIAGLGLYAAAVLSLAARAHLWNDELYTWHFAQLPSMGDVWDELSTGVEQVPPFFYVLTRVSLTLFGDNEVALRVPAMVGFALGCVCLFVIVMRRTSVWYGLLAAVIPLATGAFRYAWEARPYGLMLGFAAAAFMCQQLRNDGVRPRLALLGLALALAGATGVHYYGVLVVLPVAAGEAARAYTRRTVDWAVLGALCASFVPLAVTLPLVTGAQKYANAFWTEFNLYSAPEFYVFLVRAGVFTPSRIPDWLAIGFAVVILGGALLVLMRRPLTAHVELATAIGFVFLPLAGVVVAELVTGAYVSRYVLPAVLGPATLVPLALHRIARGRTAVGVGAAVVAIAWFGVLFQYWHRDVGFDLDRQGQMIAFLERETTPDGPPIAVAVAHDYLELAHYAPPQIARRLIRIAGPEQALRHGGSRSIEDGLVVMGGFAPLRVVSYAERRDPFLLLVTVRGGERDWNWIEPELASDGYQLQPIAHDDIARFSLLRVFVAASGMHSRLAVVHRLHLRDARRYAPRDSASIATPSVRSGAQVP